MRQTRDEVFEFLMWLEGFELDPFELKAYLALAVRARTETDTMAVLGDENDVTISDLARWAGMSCRRLHTALKTLENRGIVRRRFRKHKTSYYYLLDIPSPVEDGTWHK